MAVDLRGQADATIATAAARAGAALAGPDYSQSFQNMATGYQQGMEKMGAGLAKVAAVGALAAGNLVENIKEAKTTYTESGAWGSVMGNFKGLLKEGFDIFSAKRGDERDVQKQEFKDKWNTSVGSLKSMIDKTFMVETVIEEGEYNKAYLEENPDKAAQFSIIRSTKKNPVDAPGLPYDGCYSDMEVEDGAWVKKFYGPDGSPISSFGPDGTPIYVDKRDLHLRSDKDLGKLARTNVGLHSDRIMLTDEEQELIGYSSNNDTDFSDYEDGAYYLDPNNPDLSDTYKSQLPAFLKKYEVDEDGFLQKIGQHQPGGVDDPHSWTDYVGGQNDAIAMLLQGVPPDEVFSKQRMTYVDGPGLVPSSVKRLEKRGINTIVRGVQEHLHKLGYDLGDHENYPGGPREGIDGKWGKDSKAAFELFKKDQEEAKGKKGEIAGDLWSDISAQEERTHMSVNGNDISKLIVRKNPETQAGIQEMQLAAMESGSLGLEFKSNEYRNAVKDIVDDKDKFSDMAYTPIGDQEYSFAQLLTQPNNRMTKAMFNEVVAIGKDLAGIKDTDGDGVIDANDFQEEDAANLTILRKEMLNYNNPQARDIFFDYLTNEASVQHQAQLENYKRQNAPTGKNKDETGYTAPKSGALIPTSNYGPGNYFPKSQWFTMSTAIHNEGEVRNLDEDNPHTYTWIETDNGAGAYQRDDGVILNNKEELLSDIFGEQITQDFMYDETYQSIKDWNGSGISRESNEVATGELSGRLAGNLEAIWKEDHYEGTAQKLIHEVLVKAAGDYPQLQSIVDDWDPEGDGEDLHHNAWDSGQLAYKFPGDDEKTILDMGTPSDVEKFMNKINAIIRRGTGEGGQGGTYVIGQTYTMQGKTYRYTTEGFEEIQ